MHTLHFDKDICIACETVDCLVKCQYLDLAVETAKEEKMKLIHGEDTFVLTDCATCYGCEEYCPNGNHPFFQIVELQEAKGMYIAPKPITHQQIKMYSPKGDTEVRHVLGEPTLSLCLFPDMGSKISGQLFENTTSFLGRDFFCNLVYLHFARMSLIKERLPRVIENIWQNMRKHSLTELVCFHDECYAGFNFWAPAYGVDVPFIPVHLFDFLARRLRESRNTIIPLNEKAVYQRPCSNRLIPETQHLVDDIFELIGAERVDRKYDRENALCCGSVLIMQGRDDLADHIQEQNVEDMVEAGARYCVFNCPMCFYTLGEMVSKKGIVPLMMSELCQHALGEK